MGRDREKGGGTCGEGREVRAWRKKSGREKKRKEA